MIRELLLCAVLLALPPGPVADAAARTEGGEGVEVVWVANEGVLVRGGGRAALIDGCVREPYSIYGAVPDDVWRRLLVGQPPFERLDLVLVSHSHRDHFQAEAARELLLARPEATWVLHREVAALLAEGWNRWPEVSARVVQMAPTKGRSASWSGDGLELEIVRLPHNRARTMPENLAHVVRLGGRSIVHVGDAEARPEQLEAAGLAGRRFDVALLPYWYWEEEHFRPALEALSGRLGSVALHIPPDQAVAALGSVRRPPVVPRRPLDAATF